MNFTRTSTIRFIKIVSGLVVISIVIAYAIWRSFAYARGPHISLFEPTDWSSISASTTLVRGRVDRANNISLNGRALSIDEYGTFSETIIVFPGTNIITLQASDQFGRTIETRVRLTGIRSTD